jgi:hypothetical protein
MRGRVEEYLADLPATLRREVATPERLLALMTANNIPLGSARITGLLPQSDTETRIISQLTEPDGRKKTAIFIARRDEERWRLVVPAGVLRKYRDQLANSTSARP